MTPDYKRDPAPPPSSRQVPGLAVADSVQGAVPALASIGTITRDTIIGFTIGATTSLLTMGITGQADQ
jgi:hypothetical protein